MPDAIFDDPVLAALYDPLDTDRSDIDAYVAMVDEFGARSLLDVGCGTGELACRLALRGVDVVGVDPAGASLDVARAKAGAERVRWIHGDATTLPQLQVDLAESDGVTTLTFAQNVPDPAMAANVGPGWDYYLDRMVVAEAGGDVAAVDFDSYYPALSEHYRREFA